MRIVVSIPPSGSPVTIKAIDLTGNTWEDYRYYLAEAERASVAKDVRATHRALRSALVNLFAHVEGVVAGLHSRLLKDRPDFAPTRRRDGRYCSLKNQINDVCSYANNRMNKHLEPPQMHYKLLRDIVVHPNITKDSWDIESNEKIELSELDLFDMTVDGLGEEGKRLDGWLDQLCSTYGYARLHDTHEPCKGFGDSLGDGSAEPRRV